MDRATLLAHGSIPRLLAQFSFPAIVGMMAQAVYNVVDRIFVGHGLGPEGPLGIAGIAVCMPYMLVLLAFGMLAGFGAGSLISIRLGEGRREDAERALGNAATLLAGVSLVLRGPSPSSGSITARGGSTGCGGPSRRRCWRLLPSPRWGFS